MKPYYDHAGIQIFLGDCRDVLPQLPAGNVDLVLTDPPYGIGYAGSQSVGGTRGRTKAYWRAWETAWDEERIDAETVRSVVGQSPLSVLWGGNFYADVLPVVGGWLVWDKTQRGLSFGDGEIAWTNAVQSVRIFSLNRVHVATDGKKHPTQKPLALMHWCIKLTGIEAGSLILDPFMGSGTTLRAAKDAGCRAIGIEVEERYCEIAAKRLSQEVFAWEGE